MEGYLSGHSRIDTIYRLRTIKGVLERYAKSAIEALRILETGPVREVGGSSHAFRIFELSNLLHQSIYHSAVSRLINIEVEKELRMDIDELRRINTSSSSFVLFLIDRGSRTNPTGEAAGFWFAQSVDRDNEAFFPIIKQIYYNLDDDLIAQFNDTCIRNGWEDWDCYQFIQDEFPDDDYEHE